MPLSFGQFFAPCSSYIMSEVNCVVVNGDTSFCQEHDQNLICSEMSGHSLIKLLSMSFSLRKLLHCRLLRAG